MMSQVLMGDSRVRTRLMLLVALTLLLAASSGCSERTRIEVQSDTCWSGFVDRQARLEQCGDKSYRVTGTMECVSLSKQTPEGYLRVRIEGGPWAETTAAFGTVSVCR